MITAKAADAATSKGRSRGPGDRSRRSRKGLLALALGVVLFGATACGGSASAESGSTKNGADPKNSDAAVHILPRDGATGVDTSGALRISAAKGKLSKVTVTSSGGATVDGTLSDGGSSWRPTGGLHTGTHYTVSATATDASGRASTQQSSFTTLTPSTTNIGYFNVAPGATYGVGMEVSLNFTKPVSDTKAVDKAVTVTADPQVDVRGHWFGNQRLDFRPENYWSLGTKVTLHLRLNGVKTAPGVYGQQSKDQG
ncbi:Ig-like domain-containing protein [Streptomyces sp. MMS24-I2-30]|uniref:Ig-like domain-containing protein n=1 Tax=Streptomyces sp. MMS24-I2-30 TaxID=3351564 RepID=UPI003896C832